MKSDYWLRYGHLCVHWYVSQGLPQDRFHEFSCLGFLLKLCQQNFLNITDTLHEDLCTFMIPDHDWAL